MHGKGSKQSETPVLVCGKPQAAITKNNMFAWQVIRYSCWRQLCVTGEVVPTVLLLLVSF